MNFFLPGIQLTYTATPDVKLQPFISLHYTKPLTQTHTVFNCSVTTKKKVPPHALSEVFSGKSFGPIEIPYRWRILRGPRKTALHLFFFEDPQLSEAFSLLDFEHQTIHTTLIPIKQGKRVTIDPLFHPWGSLIMVLLTQHMGSLLIHASGVNDHNRGLLFTGVSGIGKSTMAGIWEKAGARIINDDRLWLYKVDGLWHFSNTPMIHYAQKPAMAPLNGIFLLQQAPQNNLKIISGASAAMRFMANGIQHFYDKEMTAAQLDLVLDIARQVPIYDCAFKPDKEIVEQIKQLL